MMSGRMASLLIPPASAAPPMEPASAARPIRTASFTSTGALRRYVTAAPAVPTMATALLVPSTVAGWALGSPRSRAGRSSSPPPPTTASIQPAAAAATHRTMIMVVDMSGTDTTLWS